MMSIARSNGGPVKENTRGTRGRYTGPVPLWHAAWGWLLCPAHVPPCVGLSPQPPLTAIEERRCDMLVGPVLVTYAITTLGGIGLCLLVAALTTGHRERP